MGSTRSNWHTLTVVAFVFHLLTPDGVASEVFGRVGSSVDLECSFPLSQPAAASSASLHVLEWVRQGLDIPVLIKFGSHTPRVHPQYEGRVSLGRNASLRLERLQLDDQGWYDCRVLLLDRPSDELRNSSWTLLSVSGPPTFTEVPPPVLEALVGTHLSLSCVAIGNPIPTITWLKDGTVIRSMNNQGGVLSLPAVSTPSAGMYTCHASNSEGNVTRVTNVKIKGPPVIVVPPKSSSLNMSQNALLQCQAVADPPNMTYVWQKGGENVYHIESLKSRVKIMVDGTLLISRLIPEDSGNYTCIPTNGLLTPPAASAILTVMYPARVTHMPKETYLPTGMEGRISCSVAAQPPLLRVDWTKDGEPLDLALYPGWSLKAEGTLVMATINEDAAGTYTCTPYNSYGSMGSSEPTRAVLQDPPSFSTPPEEQYKLEAGGKLLIPCQGSVESTSRATWRKVDPIRPISYSIEPNGSLLLQPLIKEHHGEWDCSISNRVATMKARTQIFVLGTSPHAASSMSVSPGVKQANISWEAGFDGGSAQTFSVWVKKMSAGDTEGKQEWFSVPVPPSSNTTLQVSDLSPATEYQFSILSQNKFGTGPFSEIVTTRTLDPPQRKAKLKPPVPLSANQGSAGVLLHWSPPEAQNPPITGFVLQTRTDKGDWFNLDGNISANSSEILIQGLQKDGVHELRLLSRRGEMLSEPSLSINVNISGMGMVPATSRHLEESVPVPLLTGVLGGVGFMCLALVLLLGSACVINRVVKRRRGKRKDESLPAIYKCSQSTKTSGSSSPDSLLKKSLLPASPDYPTPSSTITSSSSQTDTFPTSAEKLRRSNDGGRRLTKTASLMSPSIELISRGPDGRFAVPAYNHNSNSNANVRHDRPSKVRRSVSLHSDAKDVPFVLSVDFPPYAPVSDRVLQRHTPTVDDRESCSGSADLCSLCSNSSLATTHQDRGITPVFPVLPHIKSSLHQAATTASSLLLQMEDERERGNLSRCLKLAQEREELERELQRYTFQRNSWRGTMTQPLHPDGREELSWEYKSRTLPHKYNQIDQKRSRLSSSSVFWEAHPFVSQPSLLSPRKNPSSPSTDSCFQSSINPFPSLLLPEETCSFSQAQLAFPHLSTKSQQLEDVSVLDAQSSNSFTEAKRRNYLGTSSPCRIKCKEACQSDPNASSTFSRLEPQSPQEGLNVEMSVDEPEFEVTELQPPLPTIHHEASSHVQYRRLRTQKLRHQDMKRSRSFNCPIPESADSTPQYHPRSSEQGSKRWESKQRSRSLDLRRQNKPVFLAPDAWIESISQEDCSAASSPGPVFWEAPQRNIHKYSANSSPAIQTSHHRPPATDRLTLRSPKRPVPNADLAFIYEPKRHVSFSTTNQEASREASFRYAVKGVPVTSPPHSVEEELELEVGNYERASESGGSYSSYASSGRGSMDPSNPISSPETVQDNTGSSGNARKQAIPNQRRKPSVDESYEWDAADFSSQPGAQDGAFPLMQLQKIITACSPPSMPRSTKVQKKCAQLPSPPGHQSSSAQAEPDAVLF
ncbi:protein turtle homolog A [Oryzias melastigma]|uniref:Immunoglobulin superfamily, member 9a n=1 Tax=Oryzias melastigma TaxID=30732 RepID=A0A3B3DSZ6_ORYME|nr:protein turtle homolog A [Oryzias melastigma]